MKLRLKGEAFAKQVLTEFGSNTVTVAELKFRVRDILQLHDEDFLGSIQFSMNGKQALLAEDTELVSNLGFVSGDAVYVLGTFSGARKPKFPKLNPTPCEKNLEQEHLSTIMASDRQHLASLDLSTVSENFEGMNKQSREECDGNPNNAPDLEKHHKPLLDTPNMLIPQTYTRLIASNSLSIPFDSNLEKLAGILHILMVETGFQPETCKSFSDPFCILPDSWNVVSETLRLNYKTGSKSPATIVLSSVGLLVIVYGIGSSLGKTLSLKLKPSEFMPPVGSKHLRQVCIDFKNEIAFPLYVHIEREANGTCPTYFSNLPPEISYNILQRLDSKSLCRLSMTCRLFKYLANQPSLWKKLVFTDFGKTVSNRATFETINWKELYKDEFLIEKKQRETSKSIRGYTTMPRSREIFFPSPFHSPQVYPSVNGVHEFPGIMGGYSDLYPDLRGFEPPGRRQPFRNLPEGGVGFPRPLGRFRGFPNI
ncbi:F-box only protein-like protein 7 [Daphnia sinensis]|uniref:F-box only protein-like protein 7 n=1 Tax=Daphnia sinensis TaxID=1820382 RepID=A0AAD5KY23_9CRUS|nr:F-box only protein-like protein 7 [Daphnia sinensis]